MFRIFWAKWGRPIKSVCNRSKSHRSHIRGYICFHRLFKLRQIVWNMRPLELKPGYSLQRSQALLENRCPCSDPLSMSIKRESLNKTTGTHSYHPMPFVVCARFTYSLPIHTTATSIQAFLESGCQCHSTSKTTQVYETILNLTR